MPAPKYLSEMNISDSALQYKIEELAGGKKIEDLINEGLLRKADGTMFEFTPNNKSAAIREAVNEAAQGGVFLFTDLSAATPRPHFIYGEGEQIVYEEKLTPDDTKKKISDAMALPQRPEKVKRPGFFNRVRSFFSKNGTPEMNAYKQYQADLKRYNELSRKVDENHAGMNTYLHNKALNYSSSEEVHTAKSDKQITYVAQDLKRRYDSMAIRPCETVKGNVSKVNELRTDTVNSLDSVMIGMMTKFIPESEKKGLNKSLAAMTALDVVMRERVANGYTKFSDAPVIPGPIEQKLNQVGSAQFIKMISENEVFKENTADMNSKKLDEFVTKHQHHALAAKVTTDILTHEAEKYNISPEAASASIEKNAKVEEVKTEEIKVI